jgi:DNA polymerase-4
MTGTDIHTAQRKIIHIDMDAFFASVEQRDNPDLKGKPVAVGGKGARGVVAAASYEARTFGVRSAMPVATALRKCPELIVVSPNFDTYKSDSRKIRDIMLNLTELVEPLSLDEAYLDVTHLNLEWDAVIKAALQLKQEIFVATGLTATAGVSINKFLAKIASGQNKPDGLTVILPGQVQHFLDDLPVEDFYGVGKVTAQKMHDMGIRAGRDLKVLSEVELVKHFGKIGRYFYSVVRGQDDRPVEPNRERKSLSVERTYAQDLTAEDEIHDALDKLLQELMRRYRNDDQSAHTVVLKIRFDDFSTHTKQRTFDHIVKDAGFIKKTCRDLLSQFPKPLRPVRLLGIGLSGFEGAEKQLMLDF